MPAAHELTMRLRTIEVVIHTDMAGMDGRMEVGRGWRGAGRIENGRGSQRVGRPSTGTIGREEHGMVERERERDEGKEMMVMVER